MTEDKLRQLVNQLIECRAEVKELYQMLDTKKVDYYHLKREVELELNRRQEHRFVTDRGEVVYTEDRVEVEITDPQAAEEWLDKQPGLIKDLYWGAKPGLFDSLARLVLQAHGEYIPGVTFKKPTKLKVRVKDESKSKD